TFNVSIPGDPATVTSAVEGDRLTVPGAGWSVPVEPGAPLLPYRTVRIVLPQGQEVDTFSYRFGGDARIAAAFKPALAGDIVGTEGETVKGNPATKPSSAQRVKYLGTGTLDGYQVASFAVYPFGVDAGTLKRADNVGLQIDTKPLNVTVTERIRHRDGWR